MSFDDAVKTQRTFVAPLLKELGFGATFFVCHRWMVDDPEHYLTWQEIAEIHQMGFEIGNHSWTHPGFSSPKDAARMPAELALVDRELHKVGVPRPTSFAWCNDVFGAEAFQQLVDLGYRLARRGMQPEVPYGAVEVGPTYDPQKQHPLLIPSTGDNYPGWTLEHFQEVAERAEPGQIAVFEGAICPMRGTKGSVLLPWDPASYVVIDLPEAIRSNLGLTFLAHTDVLTIWDAQNMWLDNIDWTLSPDGGLVGSRVLPNQITFGSSIQPSKGQVDMELWLRNETSERLTGLRTQICVMLKGAPDFNGQTNDNKILKSPVAAVKSAKGDHWILVAWDRCGRAWGNPPVPCMHADPVLADCLPGQTVRVRGRLWFYEGNDIDGELGRAKKEFTALPSSN